MIKINLANSILKKTEAKGGLGGLPDANVVRDTVIKIALVILPVVGFRFYEGHELTQKKAHLQELIAQKEALSQELSSMGSVDEIVKQVDEQKKEMADKFNVMKQIFGLRSQKIQTLALLQKHIPQSCWLSDVIVKEDASLTNGRVRTKVSVIGFSTSIEDIQSFTSSLSLEKAIFDKVRPADIVAEEGGKSDIKKFSFDIFLKE